MCNTYVCNTYVLYTCVIEFDTIAAFEVYNIIVGRTGSHYELTLTVGT